MFQNVVTALAITLFYIVAFPYEYEYLRYVTVGQVFDEVKRFFWGWVGWSIVLVVFSYFSDSSPVRSYDSFVNSVFTAFPQGVWYVIAVASSTWILRGQKMEWPKWSGKQWLFVNCCVAIGAAFFLLLADELPHFLVALIVVSLWKSFEVYAALIKQGKSNNAAFQSHA